jgi:threonine/homoserine/homoserine lactone efflux protein
LISYVAEGIRAGLLLSLLVGPLIVLLLQLSIRRGTLASFSAALGIWISDVLFISGTHYGMGGLDAILDHTYFTEVVGTIGGAILLTIAVVMWMRQPPDLSGEREIPTGRGLFGALLQGFAVNTFNPFTVFFWSAFTLTQVHDRDLTEVNAWAIYAGILATIIVTDSAKVLGARKLRDLLKPRIVLRIQRLGALALGGFGLVLAIRVWW